MLFSKSNENVVICLHKAFLWLLPSPYNSSNASIKVFYYTACWARSCTLPWLKEHIKFSRSTDGPWETPWVTSRNIFYSIASMPHQTVSKYVTIINIPPHCPTWWLLLYASPGWCSMLCMKDVIAQFEPLRCNIWTTSFVLPPPRQL